MFGHQLNWFEMKVQSWIELVLTLPIVFWAGWPFFVRCWHSILNRSPNMWTLIGIGTGAAFIYSVVGTLAHKFSQRLSSLWGVLLSILRQQPQSFH